MRFGERIQGTFPQPHCAGAAVPPQAPFLQHCHGLTPSWDASVLPTFCGSPQFKPWGILPFLSLGGAGGLLQPTPEGRDEDGAASMLAREKGSSQRAFLQVPFAFPCTRCSLHGFSLPSQYEALFQPEGTKAATASLCTEASITRCLGGAAELASAWTWSHHPSTSTPSPPQLSALSSHCPGPGHGGESCFRGVKPFYCINCSTKPS